MEPIEKLKVLSVATQYEPAEEIRPAGCAPCGMPLPAAALQPEPFQPLASCSPVPKTDFPIHPAVMPGGKRINLLKTLQTSACERDCYYCAFRRGRDFNRVTLKPDDMAKAFLNLYRTHSVEGLFLSSGIAGGGIRTQDQLIATAEILRLKLGFKGYLHLKIMPGAEKAQVERAMQLADRVSVNLEAPNTERLVNLAPHKVFFEELLRPLQWVDEIRRSQPAYKGWNSRWPSTTTQFVVGGAGENDLELLSTTSALHKQVGLARAYFSGFFPIEDTPLENQPPTNPWREHRLYQASFLLRDYGFDLEEMPFTQEGFLPLETDPKLEWARGNLHEAPVEINRADPRQLLRVPGIGKRGVQAILSTRRKGSIHSLEVLRGLGVSVNRAAPFILLDGIRPPQQLTLW